MRFWFFMFVMNLLVPFTMIIFGKYFSKNAPENINGVFGYRTPMSRKNKETWAFAHSYCGKIWFYMGTILLFISVVIILFLIGKEKDSIGDYSLVLTAIQMVFLLSPIVPTELALRKRFDINGKRKI